MQQKNDNDRDFVLILMISLLATGMGISNLRTFFQMTHGTIEQILT